MNWRSVDGKEGGSAVYKPYNWAVQLAILRETRARARAL